MNPPAGGVVDRGGFPESWMKILAQIIVGDRHASKFTRLAMTGSDGMGLKHPLFI